MSNPLAVDQKQANLLENVLIEGDLSNLSPAERVSYYKAVCSSLGLNSLTKPFKYIILNGKLTLYALKDCTEQLRNNRGVSVPALEKEVINGIYVVTSHAVMPDGRQDSSIGAVSIEGLKGEHLANAMMKAETKSKRRVTLSICGLGMLDETEVETIHDARHVTVNVETGEISPKPDEKAWGKWHDLVRQAQDVGLTVEEPAEDINIDQLRQLYRELQAGIKAQEEAQK